MKHVASRRCNETGLRKGNYARAEQIAKSDQIIELPSLGRFFQMAAEPVAHGRKQLVLKIGVTARTETLV